MGTEASPGEYTIRFEILDNSKYIWLRQNPSCVIAIFSARGPHASQAI